ncbi:MAG: arsenate reductase ArsC [Thermoleophilia bacterium]
MTTAPVVLFVCVHNAGRSQMAARFAAALSGGRVEVRSGGSAPGDAVNPVAARAMREIGLPLEGAVPARLTDDAVRAADVVITMGCGDTCPVYPGKRYEDWQVRDPAGQDLDTVREIRDDIRGRIERLLDELGVAPAGDPA